MAMLPIIHIDIEKWKFNEEYQLYISSLGRIRNKQKKLVQQMVSQETGYFVICIDGKYRYVHRLVAETFYGKSKLSVDHIDSNKRNNRLDNLEFVSWQENLKRANNKLVRPNNKIEDLGIDPSKVFTEILDNLSSVCKTDTIRLVKGKKYKAVELNKLYADVYPPGSRLHYRDITFSSLRKVCNYFINQYPEQCYDDITILNGIFDSIKQNKLYLGNKISLVQSQTHSKTKNMAKSEREILEEHLRSTYGNDYDCKHTLRGGKTKFSYLYSATNHVLSNQKYSSLSREEIVRGIKTSILNDTIVYGCKWKFV